MSKFNFNSKICTSKVQSERLLALGLKKETADMIYERSVQYPYDFDLPRSIYEGEEFITGVKYDDIPAWSLHRLIKLAYGNWEEDIVPVYLGNSYDMLIGRIEFQVKQGKFNKEYLV